jgi:HK97 family phage prohead protease
MHLKNATKELKYITAPFDVKQVSDQGEFEGYASMYSVDLGGDIVNPGAFQRTLNEYKNRGKWPKMLWQHDPNWPIGVWKEMREDEQGLWVKGELIMETQKGLEAHALLRRGAIDSMSIGYSTKDAEYEGPRGEIRRLLDVELWEVSVVTFPMNPDAQVTAVKRLDSIKDVERILRDAGVPNAFAKLVAIHGYNEAKARVDRRDAGSVLTECQLARIHTALTS